MAGKQGRRGPTDAGRAHAAVNRAHLVAALGGEFERVDGLLARADRLKVGG